VRLWHWRYTLNSTSPEPIVIDTETTSVNPHTAKLLCVSVALPETFVYASLSPSDISLILNGATSFVGQNAKFDAIMLYRKTGVLIPIAFDTMIAQYVLHIDKRLKLEEMVKQYFGEDKEDLVAVYNRTVNPKIPRKKLPDNWYTKIPANSLFDYAEKDAASTYRLWQRLWPELEQDRVLHDWYYKVEIPVTNILVRSELAGVKIDRHRLEELKLKLISQRSELQDRIRALAGESFNLNSSKQLQNFMFKQLQLKPIRKTKTGFSTDSKTLTVLANQHAFPKLLLQYKEVDKILNTYTDSLLDKADANDRIHTTYNQTLTDTRRFSSNNPNLQNIPVRSTLGKEIRRCFIAETGNKFLILDYDQVELRLLAHFSRDSNLLSAFQSGNDVHQETAMMLGVDRRVGKILNFSLIYGKTPIGLACDLQCSESEAAQFITKYFQRFPMVANWMDDVKLLAAQSGGWLHSLCGLPLYIGDVYTTNKRDYEHVMRCAVNYPIQASSQDILKLAMVQLWDAFRLYPVIMVHDELVYEVDSNFSSEQIEQVKTIVENVVQLCVPLTITASINYRWEK